MNSSSAIHEFTDILCYTRIPKDDMIYSTKLAYSMHLAYSQDGETFIELNHNTGVLFAKATEQADLSLCAKGLKSPYLFKLNNGEFGVIAVRTNGDGSNDIESKGSVILFTSSDLLQYKEIGLVGLKSNSYVNQVSCNFQPDKNSYLVKWTDETGNCYTNLIYNITSLTNSSIPQPSVPFLVEAVSASIDGMVPGNVLSVTTEIARRLINRLTVPTNIKIEVQKLIQISKKEDLKAIKATAYYSDGTTSQKPIDWDTSQIIWNKPGTYHLSGVVHQDHYALPIVFNRADPCIAKWKDQYYFIATNDADNNHTFYIRQSDTIPGLVNAEEVLLLDTNTYEEIGNLLWAPELHTIEDNLYIFHAATPGDFFYEECHVMKLREGGDPMCLTDWSAPHRVEKKDGSFLCEEGKTISLDMTYFTWKGAHYVVWSQRQFLPVDLGAWLYIAMIDSSEPWKLISDPVLLSKPEYGWANNHTFVDEGAFALIRDDKIFLTFSSAAVDATYVVGLLTAEGDTDLLNISSWTKTNYPLLSSHSVPGEYGPGHNSYVMDDDGNIWNAYHARPGVSNPRSFCLRRVHFDIDGYPVLDLTEEKDLDQNLSLVSTEIILKK